MLVEADHAGVVGKNAHAPIILAQLFSYLLGGGEDRLLEHVFKPALAVGVAATALGRIGAGARRVGIAGAAGLLVVYGLLVWQQGLAYKDEETLEAYLALKDRQHALEAEGRYTDDAHRMISTEFMQLLSYPDEVIAAKLWGRGESDPFMLATDEDG